MLDVGENIIRDWERDVIVIETCSILLVGFDLHNQNENLLKSNVDCEFWWLDELEI